MFSELIDNVVLRSGRKDRISDIVDYANATMKELQSKCLFTRDLVELQITPDVIPYVWTRPRYFRTLRAVRYSHSAFEEVYPKYLMPGKAQQDRDLENIFFYAAGNYFVFSGLVDGQTLDLAYYTRFPRLVYYEANVRPAKYNVETQSWSYLENGQYVETLGTEEEDEAARAKVTNWLLDDYHEVVTEGTLAKLFKTVSDPRSLSTFALFKSMTDDLMSVEPHDSLAYAGVT